MKSSNISDYNKIRKILEYVYKYGCYSRDDFEGKNISKSSYDQEISRINQIFNDEISCVQKNKKKYFFFKRDYFNGFENYLINSYAIKSYTDNELSIILMSLCIISSKEVVESYSEIIKEIEQYSINDDFKDKRSTIERKIKELQSEGFLTESLDGKIKINNLFFNNLSECELKKIYAYVSFMINVTYPRVAGYFLKRKMEIYARRNDIKINTNNKYLFINSNNQNILDEKIVYDLLELCKNQKQAEIKYIQNNIEKTELFVPLKLVIDEKLGRWYLKGMKNNEPVFLRIRDIISVKGKNRCDYTKLLCECENIYKYNFISKRVLRKKPFLIRIKLLFTNNDYGFKKQFEREIIRGEIIIDGSDEIYTVYMNDPIELVPWLRSYAEKIEILDDDFNLKSYMKNSYMEMLKNYESI